MHKTAISDVPSGGLEPERGVPAARTACICSFVGLAIITIVGLFIWDVLGVVLGLPFAIWGVVRAASSLGRTRPYPRDRRTAITAVVAGLASVALVIPIAIDGGNSGNEPVDCRGNRACLEDQPSSGPPLAAFAARADDVCARMPARFERLTDPDGDGGQKPLGLGRVVEEVFTELGAVRPPAPHAAVWDDAMDLLVQSGRMLSKAEELAAAGDDAGSENAQTEALFQLQSQANELIAQIGAPFKVCFNE